jgi:dUTP pyrophosphatase
MFKIEHTGSGNIFYATKNSAGFDICANEDLVLEPGTWRLIDSGLRIVEDAGPQHLKLNDSNWEVIPELQIRPRSGLAHKHGITVLNTPSTIDADYRGPIKIMLMNHSPSPFPIAKGDRIAQGVCTLVMQVPGIPVADKERGAGGFGSTGHK